MSLRMFLILHKVNVKLFFIFSGQLEAVGRAVVESSSTKVRIGLL
jgi:hypothetical protein